MLIIVHGPAGCGKSRNKQRIADIFQVLPFNVHDGLDVSNYRLLRGYTKAKDRILVLTNDTMLQSHVEANCVSVAYRDLNI